MSVKAVLDYERKYLGYQEQGDNETRWGKSFGYDGVAWCDIFQCESAKAVGEGAAMGHYAGTESHEAWFRVHKHLTKARNEIERGFVIFWDWNKNGSPNHVEMVEEVHTTSRGTVTSVTTIGGNTGPGSRYVYRQTRDLHYFLSCGKPQFSNHATAWPGKMLVLGSDNDAVLRMQRKLGMKNDDGVFGKETLKVVKEFQHSHKLTSDGQVGNKTWGVLF